MRTTRNRSIADVETFKHQLLHWAQQFDDVVWLDSNPDGNGNQKYSSYDAILAVDAFTSIQTDFSDGFEKLKEYQSTTNEWVFGFLTYDLKNDVEDLVSTNDDDLDFPDLYFFQPKKLFFLKRNQLEIKYLNSVDDELEEDFDCILNGDFHTERSRSACDNVKIKLKIHKDEYFNKVNRILEHIHRGDIYEVNFCQEFYAENTCIHPLETYQNLNAISNPPFASFVKLYDRYALCASPERYIKRKNETIISQPIKGTAKRSKNPEEDLQLKTALQNDEKEQSENIMITDLVRNDLSKTALKGTVKVEELCKVYTFDQVHQMISTVTSKVDSKTHPVDIIKSTFPMGSMTGAPKISAMKIIEALEETKRGLYSGAIGYFDPEGNFDFNVVIRSILYNESKEYISYSVGGAITAKSDPLKEYEECLIKAKAMREVLEN
ncbi:anthranilate synthase component I family protein [Hyunsoonleella sp. SJ7]|uniref:Anthranilate synthase component I family protein n=1 Tax=Hyunsoonleella aquatilis TaxID=2762758 RepID=A0A923HB42_9FLAO|nr:anthranilate synthase component I family protein [Hyunsoonleella aquatilis]MBC3759948.1 anthranilate synthase component I family protein [Hyunsoonleella aquatilis]